MIIKAFLDDFCILETPLHTTLITMAYQTQHTSSIGSRFASCTLPRNARLGVGDESMHSASAYFLQTPVMYRNGSCPWNSPMLVMSLDLHLPMPLTISSNLASMWQLPMNHGQIILRHHTNQLVSLSESLCQCSKNTNSPPGFNNACTTAIVAGSCSWGAEHIDLIAMMVSKIPSSDSVCTDVGMRPACFSDGNKLASSAPHCNATYSLVLSWCLCSTSLSCRKWFSSAPYTTLIFSSLK